jgi:predicted dehydrogenase
MTGIGIGFVGAGLAVKPHAIAVQELAAAGRVRFAGAWCRTDAHRARFESDYGLPAAPSLEALLGDDRVGAIVVLTPPRTHAEIAVRCARAGKHVLLEKPVDVDLPAARALVDAVEAAGVRLGVVLQQRFRPGAMHLREVLRDGGLGELLSVSCAIRWWRSAEYFAVPGRGTMARDGGGVLLTQAIHTLDTLLDLVGPARSVYAASRTSGLRAIDTEDIVAATVTFACGAIGAVDATTVAYPGYPERIDIAGTRGSASLQGERLELRRHGEPSVVVEGSLAGGGGADPMAFDHAPHRRLIEAFIGALEAGCEPACSGRSALHVHALIDALLASSRTGQAVDVART